MSPSIERMVEASREGFLLDMAPKEAMEFLEFLADTSKKWEEYQLQEKLTTSPIVREKVNIILSFNKAFVKKLGKLKRKMIQKA